jgi:hypothetical protein
LPQIERQFSLDVNIMTQIRRWLKFARSIAGHLALANVASIELRNAIKKHSYFQSKRIFSATRNWRSTSYDILGFLASCGKDIEVVIASSDETRGEQPPERVRAASAKTQVQFACDVQQNSVSFQKWKCSFYARWTWDCYMRSESRG